jgi:hypothetical protein
VLARLAGHNKANSHQDQVAHLLIKHVKFKLNEFGVVFVSSESLLDPIQNSGNLYHYLE